MNILIVIGFLLSISACSTRIITNEATSAVQMDNASVTTSTPVTTFTETIPTPTAIPSQPPTQTPTLPGYFISPSLPTTFIEGIAFPQDWQMVDDPGQANISINYGGENVVSQWIFSLVAPFDTITDSVSSTQISDFWEGNTTGAPFTTLLMDESTYQAMIYLWGEKVHGSINILPTDQIEVSAWENTDTWAIVPFEQLNPKWKVIQIDLDSPIHKDFDASRYLLTIPISMVTDESDIASQIDASMVFPKTNRDSSQLATVVLTGVTALVRATAIEMEMYGNTYPAEDIGGWLRDADILHINNEIPFAENCPNPAIYPTTGLVFCSRPKYIELLDDIGTDVVDLAGDHFQDWGTDAMLYTLDLYKERNWKYYGGGANIEEGQTPALFEINGNKIAFLGCNAKQEGYARASETNPGAVHCDMDLITKQVKELLTQGYQPIVTYQHEEVYTYGIHEVLEPEFTQAAEAGAVIVSGSQAHQPHAMEFIGDSFIHYGLGNLFFDQYNEGYPMRQAFIDRHVFYGNRYISTELLTIMFVDYAKSRPMTPDEREELLSTVFNLSRWNYPEYTTTP